MERTPETPAPAGKGKRRLPPKWVAIPVLVAVALLLLRMLGPGGRPAEAPAVGGRILGPDGAPVPAVVVEAVFGTEGGAPPVTLRSPPTGADGKFAFPAAPKKWTSLRIRARRGPLAVDADLGDTPPHFALDLRMPETFIVAGIVVTDEGGRPLPGMDVRMGGRAVRTDGLGRFSFPGVRPPAAGREAPVLEISGKGRKKVRRPVPLDGGADDILVHLERE